jgi:hypothetical protein
VWFHIAGMSVSQTVHLIRLTQEREITPYPWVHPDEGR